MKQRNKLQWIIAGLLIAGILSGCRPSPVLEQVIYTHTAPETDPDTTQLDPEDDGQEDEQFQNQEDDSVDTQRDTTPETGVTAEEGTAEHGGEVTYDSTRPNTVTASQSTATTPTTSAQTTTSSANNSGESGSTGESPSPEGEAPLPTEVPGEARTYKQVVDATGEAVSVPEDVSSVTATGAAAQMVEMLSGSGFLVGTDWSLASSTLAQTAFSDLSAVATYWSTSTGSISDSDFAALLAAKPDVCFAFSGAATFTDSQVAQLQANDISYVVLPALKSAEQLKQAVTIVGQVLGGEAETTAAAYVSWVDDLTSQVSSRTSSADYVTLYISGWDSEATYSLSPEYTPLTLSTSGSGLALAYSPRKTQLVSTFLSVAHLTNESTYIQSRYKDFSGVYVAPMFHQFNAVVSGSQGGYYTSGVPTAYDLFVTHQAADGVYYQLGSSLYPGIIVADEETRAQIQANYFWQYHETNEAGYVEEGGENLYRGIAGPYNIYVNPQGMCSWAEGSVESPLEAIWAACKFTGAYSMAEVKAETAAFYQEFFGLTLTDGQLTAIFGE